MEHGKQKRATQQGENVYPCRIFVLKRKNDTNNETSKHTDSMSYFRFKTKLRHETRDTKKGTQQGENEYPCRNFVLKRKNDMNNETSKQKELIQFQQNKRITTKKRD
jgi:hypothetical protein